MHLAIPLYPKENYNENLSNSVLDKNNLQFAKQIGVSHIVAWMPFPAGNGYWDFWDLLRLRKFIESFGLKLGVIENLHLLHYDKVLLGLENRDEQIKKVCITIRNMGKAGINYLSIAFMIVGVWGHWRRGESGGGRGNAGLTSFDYNIVKDAPPVPFGEFWGKWKTSYFDPLKITQSFSRNEMWERFLYFINKILPVAEESNVKLCIHPTDPPTPKLRGLENILNNVEDFKKLFELFPSEYLGMTFCQGTFTEMEEVGNKIIDVIKYFGRLKKIFYVHFRNIRGKFPSWDEVFIDDGDIDMKEAIKAYKEIGFNEIISPDHTPVINCDDPWHVGMAYAIGFMKGII